MELSEQDLLDGKYRILRRIGTGSMGAVYLGENVRIGRRVAIKVLHSSVVNHPGLRDRFEREARIASRVASQHVVDVLDVGDTPDGPYMVMEHLDGESLEQRLARTGPLAPRDVSLVAMQLLEGLHCAHSAGVVHRDLKSDHVFFASRGDGEIVKILDFGVSKMEGDLRSTTLAGALLGTPNYMSPEQARGKTGEIDARSDLYAVAVILYEAVSGHLPFDGDNVHELLFRISLDTPTPLETWVPDVDPAFAAILRRGMARRPSDRYPTALAFLEAIAKWRERALTPETAQEDVLRHVCRVSGEPFSSSISLVDARSVARTRSDARLRRTSGWSLGVPSLALLTALLLGAAAQLGESFPATAAEPTIAAFREMRLKTLAPEPPDRIRAVRVSLVPTRDGSLLRATPLPGAALADDVVSGRLRP